MPENLIPIQLLIQSVPLPSGAATAIQSLFPAVVLDKIAFRDYAPISLAEGFGLSIQLVIHGEAAISLPGIDGLALVFNSSGTGDTAVDLTCFVSPTGYRARLDHASMALRFPQTILSDPATGLGAEIGVTGSIILNEDLSITFEGFDEFSLARGELGGAGGPLIKDACLKLSGFKFPDGPAVPDGMVGIGGTLVLAEIGIEAGVHAVFSKVNGASQFYIRSTADVDFGSGIQLHPVENEPVLTARFQTQTSLGGDIDAQFNFKGELDFPLADQTAALVIAGGLDLARTAGLWHVVSGEIGMDAPRDFTLPGGITMGQAMVNLAYAEAGATPGSNAGFAVTLTGHVKISGAGDWIVKAGVKYDPTDPARIQIDGSIEHVRFNLSTFFAVQDAALVLTASSQPLSGSLTLSSSSASLFASPETQSFLVSAKDFSASISMAGDQVGIQFLSGTLHLPPVFSQDSQPAAMTLSSNTPVSLVIERSGMVRIDGSLLFTNFGANLPGLDANFSIHLDTATLTVTNNQPALTKVEGDLRLPRPDDPAQVIDVHFKDAAWDLNGYPTGEIFLPTDVEMPLGTGFKITIVGVASNPAAATSLTVTQQNAAPVVKIAGDFRLSVSKDVLTDENGREVTSDTNGSVTFKPNNLPVFGPGQLSLNANFRLGGANGILVKNAGLQLLTGTFDPQAGSPPTFTLHVAGELVLPNADASVKVAGVFTNGGFDIRSSVSVHLGSGVWLHPLDASIPVLVVSSGASQSIQIHAAIQMPSDNPVGIGAMEVSGALNFTLKANGSLQIDSLLVMSAISGADWTLPGKIRLSKAKVALGYDGQTQTFAARLGGQVLLGADSVSGSVTFLAGLHGHLDDPLRVDLVADILVNNLNLLDTMVLVDGTFHLEAHTSPLSGKLTLVNVSGGLFPLAAAQGQAQKFQLSVQNLSANLDFSTTALALTVTSGQLTLPDVFSGADGTPPSVAIADQALTIQYTYSPAALSFSGSLLFSNFGLHGQDDTAALGFQIDTATLTFSSSQLPSLSEVSGKLSLPDPSDGQKSVDILFDKVGWKLDGVPEGEIILGTDISLPLGGDFEVVLLGKDSDSQGISMSVTNSTTGGAPTFKLTGSLQFNAPVSMITGENGDQVSARVDGASLEWTLGGLPVMHSGILTIGEPDGISLHLGGRDGLLIQNAKLSLNPEKVFDLLTQGSSATVVQIGLGGEVIFPGGALSLELAEAVFEFTGGAAPVWPRFHARGFTVGTNKSLLEGLPIYVTEAGLFFKDDTKALPDLLYPENVEIHLSAGFGLHAGDSIIGGQVNQIVASIIHGLPAVELSGIGFGVDKVEILSNSFTGEVYLGGLANFPNHLENIYMAGKLGGKVQGAGIGLLAALNVMTTRPLGYCIDISGGPAGIPLGQTGFLLTGVSGGVSFTNKNGDPCDFAQYIELDAAGRPVDKSTSASSSNSPAKLGGPEMPSERPQPSGEPDCPGDCPPASMNILCQPHPDGTLFPNRAILKFSSLDEAFITRIGLADVLHTFDGQIAAATQSSEDLAILISNAVIDKIMESLPALIPPLPGPYPDEPPGFADIMRNPAGQWKKIVQPILEDAIKTAIEQARSRSGGTLSLYAIVRDALYAGVPCPDATLQLSATLSYIGVSAFLSVTGGVNISTTDTVGIIGSVNVFGIPLGKLRAFMTITSATGGIEPSICGDLRFVAGPLDLGSLSFLYQVPSAIDELPAQIIALGSGLAPGIVRGLVTSVTGRPLDSRYAEPYDPQPALRSLSSQEAVAFAARLLSLPLTTFTQAERDAVRDFLVALMEAYWESFKPNIVLCGKVAPKIFGLPLGGKLIDVKGWITKERMGASFEFSPLFLLSLAFPINGLFVPTDRASFGFGMKFPPIDKLAEAGMTGQITSPDELIQLVENGFGEFLDNASLTFSYQLSPMGMKLAEAAARAIMPYLVHHPASPGSGWVRPENRGSNLPSRAEVLQVALQKGKLADSFWAGNLGELYPDRSEMQNMQLIRDYFPHGGILGAGKIVMPLALREAPPLKMIDTILHSSDILTRVKAAFEYVTKHVLPTEEAGALTFYMPAPNPPTFAVGGTDLTPRELMESITRLEFPSGPISAGPAYSLDTAIFGGYVHGKLLGVNIGDATIELVPPAAAGGTGYFLIKADTSSQPWLNHFVRQASLRFIIRAAPTNSIEDRFAIIAQALAHFLFTLMGDAARQEFPEIAPLLVNSPFSQYALTTAEIESSLIEISQAFANDLPKVALEAALQAQDLFAPPELSQILSFSGGLQLLAYSPHYDPDYLPTDTSAGALARRQGGILLKGAVDFGSPSLGLQVSIPQAELSVIPTNDHEALPRLIGNMEVQGVQFPYNLPSIGTARLAFDSQPDTGQPYLMVSASLHALKVANLGLKPLHGDSLSFGLAFLATSVSPGFRTLLRIDPAQLSLPAFGLDSNVKIYGASPDQPFDIDSGGLWTATVAFTTLTLNDPITGQPVLQIGQEGKELVSELQGNGLSWRSLKIQIPMDLPVTAFPGKPYAYSLKPASGGQSVIILQSSGDFSVNLEIDALNFGIFELVSPIQDNPLQLTLNTKGLAVSASTLSMKGLSTSLLTVDSFIIKLNGDFKAKIATSPLVLSGICEVSSSSMRLVGSSSFKSLALRSPVVTLMPGTALAKNINGKGVLEIDSSGRFYFEADDIGVDFGTLFKATGDLIFRNDWPENLVNIGSIDNLLIKSGGWMTGSDFSIIKFLEKEDKYFQPMPHRWFIEALSAISDFSLLGHNDPKSQEKASITVDCPLTQYKPLIDLGQLEATFETTVSVLTKTHQGDIGELSVQIEIKILDVNQNELNKSVRKLVKSDFTFGKDHFKLNFNHFIPPDAVTVRISISLDYHVEDDPYFVFTKLSLTPTSGMLLSLSNASLHVGALPGFSASGDILIASDHVKADLSTSSFGVAKLAKIGAANGQLEFKVGEALKILIASPEVSLLGESIVPPAEMAMSINSNGHFSAALRTTEIIRLLPNLFEIHPATDFGETRVILDLNPAAGTSLLAADGIIKILKMPNSDYFFIPNSLQAHEWLMDFQLDPSFNLLSPFNLHGLGQGEELYFGVKELAVIYLASESKPTGIKLVTTDGGFMLEASCYVELLGYQMDMKGLISASGDMSASVSLQNPGQEHPLLDLGPFHFKILPKGAFVVEANLFDFANGYFSLTVPDWTLTFSVEEIPNLPFAWPEIPFHLPGFTVRERFTKNNFDFGTLSLPSFRFHGINLLAKQGPIQLQRDGNSIKLLAKNHQNFWGLEGDMALDIIITSPTEFTIKSEDNYIYGNLSIGAFGGTMTGTVKVKYDDSDSEYPFRGTGSFHVTYPTFYDPVNHTPLPKPDDYDTPDLTIKLGKNGIKWSLTE